jgi:hypothetical protein
MRFSTPIAALSLLSALGLVAASDVLDLTSSSFKGEVLGEDLALVEFFAPCESAMSKGVLLLMERQGVVIARSACLGDTEELGCG